MIGTGFLKRLRVLVGAGCATMAMAGVAQDAVPMSVRVDHRGLIEIPGLLRMNSGHHWGAANLIVFGPSWGYTAQDYALKNIQKTGGGDNQEIAGDLSVPGAKIKVKEVVKRVKSASGKSALRVSWTLSSAEAASNRPPLKL